ncbi:DUF4407 domain-containing protein [Polaribacter sp.]|uniref:DUF4407 domain-containing protein n=1 Tax=Polaribacter sp. TaxID=1920175 RepID=UPI0025EFEE41|nr:DUF4407 domain-containing protein [Polaribacter sp.]
MEKELNTNQIQGEPKETEIQNYNLDLNDYLKDTKVSLFTKFLWWCCGADKKILIKATNYDRVKYAGIGAIVLVTGILAAVSGGFAFSTIFATKEMAVDKINTGEDGMFSILESIDISSIAVVIFAIFWGLMIFNIDRFIISSTGKGDGTDKITRGELGRAFPRLLIAIILGITISKPLELKIFESEINAELEQKQRDYQAELDEKTTAKFDKLKKELDEKRMPLREKRNDLNKTLEERRLEILNLEEELQYEIQGRVKGRKGSGRGGYGPAAKKIEQTLAKRTSELENLKLNYAVLQKELGDEIKGIKLQITELDGEQKTERINNKKLAKGLDGLLQRIKIGDEVAGIIGYFLMALLLSIETGPLFFKMMMNKGPYDYMEENLKNKIKAFNGIVIEYDFYPDGKNGKKIKKINFLEVKAEEDIAKTRVAGQTEINNSIIESYKTSEIKNIKNNPEDYIS